LTKKSEFISGNQATINMFQCRHEEELKTRTLVELSPEFQPDGQLSKKQFKKMIKIAFKEESHYFEWRYRRLNGEEFPSTVQLTRMQLQDQAVLLAIIRDITQQKRLDRLKDEFVSTVTHELRTPLVAIGGSVNNILKGIAGKINPKVKEYLKISNKNIKRLDRLISDLLDFSRITRGDVKLNLGATDVCKIMSETITEFSPQFKDKKLKCAFYPKPKIIQMNADTDKLSQVFSNLIQNAIKFTPRNGEINIHIKYVGLRKNVRIIVEDSGVGIEERNFGLVFERFVQFGRKEGKGTKGTGLGLSICKAIVNAHNGTVEVKSIYRQGSQFIIHLPIKQRKERPFRGGEK